MHNCRKLISLRYPNAYASPILQRIVSEHLRSIKGETKEYSQYLHLHTPRGYTCRLLGVARADSRGCKTGVHHSILTIVMVATLGIAQINLAFRSFFVTLAMPNFHGTRNTSNKFGFSLVFRNFASEAE